MLNIVVDENIAFAKQAFNEFGNVILLPGREITNDKLRNTQILIIRSVTQINETLLKNTPVMFVGTTTIGTDHIDLDYLRKNNIAFCDAKGCNAYSVAEYVIAALIDISVKLNFSLKHKTIGIVGVGNVGSKVAEFAEAFGMKVLLNDPPLQRYGVKKTFVNLEKILSADIITLHTPLNLTGTDKTFHLLNINNLKQIKDGAVLINTARGAVINNTDLLEVIESKNLKVVLDVWENEPDIKIELLKQVLIATPHIAGYSLEGKINGTKLIYNSLCTYLKTRPTFSFDTEHPSENIKILKENDKIEISLNTMISSIYSTIIDDKKMRKILNMQQEEAISYFDLQRKEYPTRREFNNYKIKSEKLSETTEILLNKLRFKLIT